MLLWDFQEPTAPYQTRGDSGRDQISPVHCEQEPMDSGRTQNCFNSGLPRTLGNKKQILPVPSEIQSLGKISRPGLAQTCQPQFLSGLESQGFGCSWFGLGQRCRGEPGTVLFIILWVHIFHSCESHRASVSNFFGTRDWFHERQFFQGLRGGVGSRMIQVCYLYCTLFLLLLYTISIITSAPPWVIRH